MVWLFAALAGYTLSSISKIIDKILLARAIPDPSAFTFFVGILSGGVVMLVPFGFAPLALHLYGFALISGVGTLGGLYFLYKALNQYDASRVVPLVATIGPFCTLGASMLVFHDGMARQQLFAFFFLVVGSILLTWEPYARRQTGAQLFLYSCMSGICIAISFVTAKVVFNETSFVNGVIWLRMAVFLSALLLLLSPRMRTHLYGMPRVTSSHKVLFVADKIIGALGLFAISFAIKSGTPALVNALGGFEYLSVFILTVAISLVAPRLLHENMMPQAIELKAAGVVVLGLSLFLLFIP